MVSHLRRQTSRSMNSSRRTIQRRRPLNLRLPIRIRTVNEINNLFNQPEPIPTPQPSVSNQNPFNFANYIPAEITPSPHIHRAGSPNPDIIEFPLDTPLLRDSDADSAGSEVPFTYVEHPSAQLNYTPPVNNPQQFQINNLENLITYLDSDLPLSLPPVQNITETSIYSLESDSLPDEIIAEAQTSIEQYLHPESLPHQTSNISATTSSSYPSNFAQENVVRWLTSEFNSFPSNDRTDSFPPGLSIERSLAFSPTSSIATEEIVDTLFRLGNPGSQTDSDPYYTNESDMY